MTSTALLDTTPALLVLEDGSAFPGDAFGARGTALGEVVFNTAMTGYQEVLTDPSYHGQLVTMTYPHQGNYGLTPDDDESTGIRVAGFIVRECSPTYSNWRARAGLPESLEAAGVVGISEVDTRALTRHIRDHGAMRAGISSEVTDPAPLLELVRASPVMQGAELVSAVSTVQAYRCDAEGEERYHVVVYDYGLKRNQVRLLRAHGCAVTVVPADTTAADVLAMRPDGVFLSNGPGDPAAVGHAVDAVRELLDAAVPIFGICLGHQLLGRAVGAQTYKLPFGHHGVNQPIRNLASATVEIASHNHGFAVDASTLPGDDGPYGRAEETHVNLNDGSNAGLRLRDAPAFSVQYHPEAAPGPHDSRYLFAEFCALMDAVPTGAGAGTGQGRVR